ncbi:MAG: RNA polymerase sigma factor [Flavobacterium sp.]|uniref:RNA polymerase sigma factor n=1 Tax=Flavobacterium sp. TaxID=239 RepID=UPI0011F61FEB|nr:RNA polymerase sigma factor [Flavobacterium sp.]RZJ67833.1 MAG: RNA polymerase sigma factor [Flavobacterium sp.]
MENTDSQGICSENIFTRFFNQHVKGLRNYLYFKFGNPDLADDLAQDAFIKLWQNCADVRHPKSFIFTVANNAAINHTKYEKVVLAYQSNNFESTTDYANPEFLIEEEEFRQKFDRAIASLTEAQRTAILLNRIEGKKYKEIAEMLDISVKAVEKRIHGALVSLREQIDNFR